MNLLNRSDASPALSGQPIAVAGKAPTARQSEKALPVLGAFDSLTTLANRALFLSQLEATVKRHRQKRQSFALILMDIDDFESIGSQFGRIAGDQVIRDLANRLRSSLRGGDMAARYGEDEFTILIEEVVGPYKILRVVERIRGICSQPFFIKGASIQIAASVGCALYPQDGLEPDAMLQGAFEAIRREKERRAFTI
jgi:diguanylate cyclase (GGDEF)-like protein